VLYGASCGWLAVRFAAVTLLNPFTGARVEVPPADDGVAAASWMLVSRKDVGRWVLHPEDDYRNAAGGVCSTSTRPTSQGA